MEMFLDSLKRVGRKRAVVKGGASQPKKAVVKKISNESIHGGPADFRTCSCVLFKGGFCHRHPRRNDGELIAVTPHYSDTNSFNFNPVESSFGGTGYSLGASTIFNGGAKAIEPPSPGSVYLVREISGGPLRIQ